MTNLVANVICTHYTRSPSKNTTKCTELVNVWFCLSLLGDGKRVQMRFRPIMIKVFVMQTVLRHVQLLIRIQKPRTFTSDNVSTTAADNPSASERDPF